MKRAAEIHIILRSNPYSPCTPPSLLFEVRAGSTSRPQPPNLSRLARGERCNRASARRELEQESWRAGNPKSDRGNPRTVRDHVWVIAGCWWVLLLRQLLGFLALGNGAPSFPLSLVKFPRSTICPFSFELEESEAKRWVTSFLVFNLIHLFLFHPGKIVRRLDKRVFSVARAAKRPYSITNRLCCKSEKADEKTPHFKDPGKVHNS